MTSLHISLILWIVPRYLSSKSFIHGIIHFFFLLIRLLSQPHAFSLFTKISPSLREVSVPKYEDAHQKLSFVWRGDSLLHCCFFMASGPMSTDGRSKLLREMWVENSASLYGRLRGLRLHRIKCSRKTKRSKTVSP